ncbi:MAG: LuxR C-terminal-related transcriptional regulator, partial [Chloroflexota bacterium]
FYLALCQSITTNDLGQVRKLFEQALAALEEQQDSEGIAETLVHLGITALLVDDYISFFVYCQRALTFDLKPPHKIFILLGRCWSYVLTDRTFLPQAKDDLEEVFLLARQSPTPDVFQAILLMMDLPLFLFLDIEPSFRRFFEAIPVDRVKSYPALEILYIRTQAIQALLHGKLTEGLHYAEQFLAQAQEIRVDYGELFGLCGMAAAALNQVDNTATYFDLWLDRLTQFDTSPEKPYLDTSEFGTPYLLALGRAACFTGDETKARQILAQLTNHASQPNPLTQAMTQLLQGLIALHTQHYDEALICFTVSATLTEKTHLITLGGNPHFLIAVTQLALGDEAAALETVTPVLAECERHSTQLSLLREGPVTQPILQLARTQGRSPALAQQLLDQLSLSTPKMMKDDVSSKLLPEALVDPLTQREQEMLTLIAQGFTNRQIAEQLVVSESTVKTHLYRAYQKLGVTSRVQAVERARALALVV